MTDNGGAIPVNVLTVEEPEAPSNVLIGSNTSNVDGYQRYCLAHGLEPHPARMPMDLAKFFIQLCTEKGDVVLDPFGGSNTTGGAAEQLGRQWITIEANRGYAQSGRCRFREIV